MKTQARNWPLRIGTVLALLLLAVAIFGPGLAPHDPLEVYKRLRINNHSYGGPPLRALPPFETARFPLGVDYISRDVLSRLLWTVRPTLILCAVVVAARLLIGLVVGRLVWSSRNLADRLNQRVEWRDSTVAGRHRHPDRMATL